MSSNTLASGDNSLDQITRLEAMLDTLLLGAGAWETKSVDTHHLARLPPYSTNDECRVVRIEANLCSTLSHTSRIYPMSFRVALLNAIELCAPATPHFKG